MVNMRDGRQNYTFGADLKRIKIVYSLRAGQDINDKHAHTLSCSSIPHVNTDTDMSSLCDANVAAV